MSKESAAQRDPEKRGADAATAIEDLLVAALDALSSEGEEGIERLLAMHPVEAPRLRTHLNRLHQYGFVPSAPGAEEEGPALQGEFPARLGGFRLLVRIGGGGMGVVFLAEQEKLGRRVALKLMRTEQLYFPGARQRFEREVESIARLQHPGIVPVHAAGEDGGVPWLAMDYVAGASLDEVIAQLQGRDPARLRGADLAEAIAAQCAARPASLRNLTEGLQPSGKKSTAVEAAQAALFSGSWSTACLRIARSVAEALAHAHARGVLHRDVKPSNVMITPGGSVLLLDFGLARSEGASKLTGTSSLLGSPAYMSPEQVRGEREIDARTDVYSLGVTLYELFTLRTAYAGANVEATRRAVLAGNPTPLRKFHPALPRDAELICKKAMMPEVAERYADMAAFAGDLANALELRPITARPPSAWLIAKRWAQRHPARAVFLAALFLLLSVVPTGFLIQERVANQRIKSALAVARTNRARALEAIDAFLMRVADEELLLLPRMQKVRHDLLSRAREFYERFLNESSQDVELQEVAAQAALHLAVVDGELGNGPQALEGGERAVALARELHNAAPEDLKLVRLLAEALGSCASAMNVQARFDEGLALLDEAIQFERRALARDPQNVDSIIDLMGYERSRSFYLSQLGRFEEAIAGYQAIGESWASVADQEFKSTEAFRCVSHVIGSCADEAQLLAHLNRIDELKDVLERSDQFTAEFDPEDFGDTVALALVRLNIARAQWAQVERGNAECEHFLRAALLGLQPILDRSPELERARRTLALVYNNLGVLLKAAPERTDEGMAMMQRSIEELRKLISLDPASVEPRGNTAASLVNLAGDLRDLGQLDKAKAALEESEELIIQVRAEAPTQAKWEEVHFNVLWYRGLVHGELGQANAEVETAKQLEVLRPRDARAQRIAAGFFANAARWVEKDRSLEDAERIARAQELDERAFQLLQAAAELGCVDAEWARTAPDLAAVRAMDGFEDLARCIEDNAARVQK